jgi:hypothetical protein
MTDAAKLELSSIGAWLTEKEACVAAIAYWLAKDTEE